jgi:hypothetical protein
MKKLALFIAILSLFCFVVPCFGAGILRVHSTNPRYFTDDSGDPIYLTGSHTWYNFQTRVTIDANSYLNTTQDMEDYLDYIEGFGHNFTRLWTGWAYMDGTTYPGTGAGDWPWSRSATGGGFDGGNQWDLTSFDSDYFDKVVDWIVEVESRGMYVSVMLFGSMAGYNGRWVDGSATVVWHPDENTTLDDADVDPDDLCHATNGFYTSSTILAYQKALAEKFIDTLYTYDNVIWEIANEPPESTCAGGIVDAWVDAMVDYIQNYEQTTYSKQHLVAVNYGGSTSTNLLKAMNAEVIGPTTVPVDYKEGGEASYSSQVVVHDTDHTYGFSYIVDKEDIRKSVWKTFLRGNHTIFMDSYDAIRNANMDNCQPSDPCPNTEWDLTRNTMGWTLDYANKVNDLAGLIPSESVGDCSTQYCLRNTTDREYLAYQDGTGNFTVNLVAGNYAYEWFNPTTGTIAETGTFAASAGDKTFTPPFSGDALLYLSPIGGLVYYVDLDGGSGGDGSFGNPWNDLNDVNNYSFFQGDDVRFKSSTVSAAGTQLLIDWSGAAADRAVVGCYWDDNNSPNHDCSGLADTALPRLTGGGTYTGTKLLIHGDNTQEYVTIEYLAIVNGSTSAGSPVQLDSNPGNAPNSNIIFQYNVIERWKGSSAFLVNDSIIRHNKFHLTPMSRSGASLEVTALFITDPESPGQRNSVYGNIIHGSARECIGAYKLASYNDIYNNVCVDTYSYFIYLGGGGVANKVHHNLVYKSSTTGTHTGSDNQTTTMTDENANFPVGITGGYFVAYRHCGEYDIGVSGGNLYNVTKSTACVVTANTATTITCAAGGMDWDNGDIYRVAPCENYPGASYAIVNGCEDEFCVPREYQFCGSDHEIYNNLIARTSRGISFVAESQCTGLEDDFLNMKVHNNTIVDTIDRNYHLISGNAGDGNVFRDNISAVFSGTPAEINECSPTGWSFTHNSYKNTQSGNCANNAYMGQNPDLTKASDWDELDLLEITGLEFSMTQDGLEASESGTLFDPLNLDFTVWPINAQTFTDNIIGAFVYRGAPTPTMLLPPIFLNIIQD